MQYEDVVVRAVTEAGFSTISVSINFLLPNVSGRPWAKQIYFFHYFRNAIFILHLNKYPNSIRNTTAVRRSPTK